MKVSIPLDLQKEIFELGAIEPAEQLKLTQSEVNKIASNILEASDFYISNPDMETPWEKSWMQRAQTFYYLPLNHARIEGVLGRFDQKSFFKGLSHLYDFGAGLGAATRALKESHDWKSINLIERSASACELLKNSKYLSDGFSKQGKSSSLSAQEKQAGLSTQEKSFGLSKESKSVNIIREKDFSKKIPQGSLVVFSYSLTELDELPSWVQQATALIILEPSTQADGRKLLELRNKLLQEGFFLWAPCTHQDICPLLNESQRDWCHDRFHFDQPEWFQEIEKALPIKNKTLTTSYLVAHRNPPPRIDSNIARMTGDQLVEKGKNRQLICRGPQREFLAWMHKSSEPQEILRGELVEIPAEIQKVSNELRVVQELKLIKEQSN